MESSDGDLVRAVRLGQRAAFEELTQRHRPRIHRFLATMTGSDSAADDIAQDALQNAWQRLDQLGEPDRFDKWLLAIAVNRCRNWLRAEVQRAHDGDSALAAVADTGRRSALSSIVRRESAEQLALAVDRLPILLREAFVLFVVEGLPYAAIAEACAASENTLQVRVHRAKALLRQQLGAVVDTWWQRRD
jgi:RNA polymerase sigma factor (sigma-70 family)